MKVATKRNGWIGVDVGTSQVKVVQLVRNQNGFRLAASAIIPRPQAWDVTVLSESEGISSATELTSAINLGAAFRGRQAAAILPMSMCQVHQIDQQLGKSGQREKAIRKAIEMVTRSSADHLQFAAWPAEQDAKRNSPARNNVLAVPQAWTDQLCQDITGTGWSCQLIDGLPQALARAVGMVHQGDRSAIQAALDWGYSQATFCAIVDRRPVYVRCLKDCSLKNLLDSLTTELGISEAEALGLLQDHGLASSESTEVSRLVAELVTPSLARLESELQRTIDHLKAQRRTIVPQGVYLFGGGATVRGIAERLSESLERPHRVWDFGNRQSADNSNQPHTCLLGPAVALSALAWEKL